MSSERGETQESATSTWEAEAVRIRPDQPARRWPSDRCGRAGTAARRRFSRLRRNTTIRLTAVPTEVPAATVRGIARHTVGRFRRVTRGVAGTCGLQEWSLLAV